MEHDKKKINFLIFELFVSLGCSKSWPVWQMRTMCGDQFAVDCLLAALPLDSDSGNALFSN
jgi:hypothetical protein